MTPKTPTLREAAQSVVDADTALRRYIDCGGDLNAGERMTKALEDLRTALASPAQGDDALDARRYRWLRHNTGEVSTSAFDCMNFQGGIGDENDAAELDRAIDAALASQENKHD